VSIHSAKYNALSKIRLALCCLGGRSTNYFFEFPDENQHCGESTAKSAKRPLRSVSERRLRKNSSKTEGLPSIHGWRNECI